VGEAIGQVLPFAIGVAISPMPVVAMVLMLITPQARSNGVTFVLGWMLGIAVAGAILLSIASPADASDEGAPADWVSWLKLLLGVLLVLVAVKEWKARPAPGAEAPMPKWMSALDGITPVKAGGLAILLGTINPKNLLLIVGGTAAVAQTGVSAGDQTVAWIVFTLIATIGVAAPLVVYFAMGDRAPAILEELKDWMARNNTAVMAVLCLVIGVKLFGDAITGLSS
jgi:threonine/homoserine/homoserine lactone efflux protein